MNVLSCHTNTDHGLSFELFVDGQPLHELVGGEDGGIPYWIVEDDLPYLPPMTSGRSKTIGTPRLPHTHIVCVCSCGEYGCGHTRCQVERRDSRVLWSEFDIHVSDAGRSRIFQFTRENYDVVVADMVRQAQSQKQLDA
jgi:hypothetical protein